MTMSEREKMLAGHLYDATDAELVARRRRARDLLDRLNTSADSQADLRASIYASLFGAVGSDFYIQPPFYCDYGTNIHVGDRVFFNFDCVVLDPAEVHIGNNVLFGPAVQIYTATHPMDASARRSGLESALPIHIGSDVWVGGGAIVCPGVTIGEGSVIGAGAVVTRDVPAGVFAAGNPCRVVRELA